MKTAPAGIVPGRILAADAVAAAGVGEALAVASITTRSSGFWSGSLC